MCVWIKKIKINRLIKKIRVLQNYRIHNQPTDEALAKEIALYHRLAALYMPLQFNKKWPYARILRSAAYRASSMLNDPIAQFTLGKELLDEAKFREQLQIAGVFSSENNARQIHDYYLDAHAYLLAASTLGSIQAKRLYGLCYINGWGVDADKDRGFELVVESIEAENSWDKVPQIFKEIGLNKPEFFTALMQRRQKN